MLVAGVALGVGLVPRLSAFTGPDVREGLVTPDRPLSLNPLIGADAPAIHDVGHLLYRSLLRLDSSAYPQPDLATGYSVDQSGLVYTVRMTPSERWSDGRPITPADVIATFAFAQSKRASDRSLAGVIAGVRAKPKADTVVFTLPAPRVSFVATLTQIPILPLGALSSTQIAALPTQAATAMTTSGAYRVASSDAGAVELVANPNARVKPALGRFELRLYATFDEAAAAFQKGDVDAVLATTPSQRARLLAQPQSIAHDITTFRFVDLLFNERVFGLDDPVVRQAIATAVSRSAIVGGALVHSGGLMETNAISRGLPWVAADDPHELAAPEAARAALDAAGWNLEPGDIRQRNGVTLSFSVVVPNTDPLPKVAQELSQQLAGIGIAVTVSVRPTATFVTQDVSPHSFQLALADWDSGPDPDVSAFWRSNATPPNGFYVSGGGADPFLDQALDLLATIGTRTGRVSAAVNVSTHLLQDAPAVFLYTPTVSYVMRGAQAASSVPRVGSSEARFDAVTAWRRS